MTIVERNECEMKQPKRKFPGNPKIQCNTHKKLGLVAKNRYNQMINTLFRSKLS